MENEHTIELFALTLPYAPNMINLVPADTVAHGGASIADATAVEGFGVMLFAYVGQAENDLITLYLNDEFAKKVTIAKGKENEDTTLTIPSGRFQRGKNTIKFGVKRPSQNEEFTKDLILLYRSSPPGDVPPVLAIDVSHKSIGAGEADNVSVTVTYKNPQWYDWIFVDCNGVVVGHQLVPDVEPPVSAPPQTVVIPIAREVLEQGGDDSDFTFKFRVVDNLTNSSGPPVWSDIVNADVHLNRVMLAMPILREIPTENNDDPAIVDLAKLNGPLWALIHLIASIWQPGDQIHLVFTAELNGVVVATYEVTLPIGQVPGQLSVDIPNDKVVAGSVVKVKYEQIRLGKVISVSRVAEAQVIGVPFFGSENWEEVPLQTFRVGAPVTFKSGLTFSLVSQGHPTLLVRNAPRPGNHLQFGGLSKGRFSWSKGVKRIDFLHFHVACQGSLVTFYDALGKPIDSIALPISPTDSPVSFTHVSNTPFLSFEVDSSAEVITTGFHIDDMRWLWF